MFEDLPKNHFGVITADPPWKFGLYSDKGNQKSPDQHYETVTLDDIKKWPVADLALPDSVLILWATFPMLDFARETMTSWGFRYSTGGAWMKTTKEGQPCFGTGFVLRSAAELFLIGVRGKPKVLSKSVRNVLTAPEDGDVDLAVALTSKRRQHSRKPRETHEMVETLFPGPYLELNAREAKRPGWWFWGDELDRPF